MADKAFLTDRRKEILDGATADDMGISDATVRQHRAAIKRQAQSALRELREVAQSSEFDNREIFDPEELGNLLFWILNDPSHFDQLGGLVAQEGEEIEADEEAVARYSDELASYRNDVYAEVDGPLRSVRHPERGRR